MMPNLFAGDGRAKELYRDGYKEGLDHNMIRLTRDYTDLPIEEREVYDSGFRDGRRERWRREEEEERGWR